MHLVTLASKFTQQSHSNLTPWKSPGCPSWVIPGWQPLGHTGGAGVAKGVARGIAGGAAGGAARGIARGAPGSFPLGLWYAFFFFHPSHKAQGSKPKAQGSNPKEKGKKNRSPQSPGCSSPQSPGGYSLLNLSKEKEIRKRGCKFRKKRIF